MNEINQWAWDFPANQMVLVDSSTDSESGGIMARDLKREVRKSPSKTEFSHDQLDLFDPPHWRGFHVIDGGRSVDPAWASGFGAPLVLQRGPLVGDDFLDASVAEIVMPRGFATIVHALYREGRRTFWTLLGLSQGQIVQLAGGDRKQAEAFMDLLKTLHFTFGRDRPGHGAWPMDGDDRQGPQNVKDAAVASSRLPVAPAQPPRLLPMTLASGTHPRGRGLLRSAMP